MTCCGILHSITRSLRHYDSFRLASSLSVWRHCSMWYLKCRPVVKWECVQLGKTLFSLERPCSACETFKDRYPAPQNVKASGVECRHRFCLCCLKKRQALTALYFVILFLLLFLLAFSYGTFTLYFCVYIVSCQFYSCRMWISAGVFVILFPQRSVFVHDFITMPFLDYSLHQPLGFILFYIYKTVIVLNQLCSYTTCINSRAHAKNPKCW